MADELLLPPVSVPAFISQVSDIAKRFLQDNQIEFPPTEDPISYATNPRKFQGAINFADVLAQLNTQLSQFEHEISKIATITRESLFLYHHRNPRSAAIYKHLKQAYQQVFAELEPGTFEDFLVGRRHPESFEPLKGMVIQRQFNALILDSIDQLISILPEAQRGDPSVLRQDLWNNLQECTQAYKAAMHAPAPDEADKVAAASPERGVVSIPKTVGASFFNLKQTRYRFSPFSKYTGVYETHVRLPADEIWQARGQSFDIPLSEKLTWIEIYERQSLQSTKQWRQMPFIPHLFNSDTKLQEPTIGGLVFNWKSLMTNYKMSNQDAFQLQEASKVFPKGQAQVFVNKTGYWPRRKTKLTARYFPRSLAETQITADDAKQHDLAELLRLIELVKAMLMTGEKDARGLPIGSFYLGLSYSDIQKEHSDSLVTIAAIFQAIRTKNGIDPKQLKFETAPFVAQQLASQSANVAEQYERIMGYAEKLSQQPLLVLNPKPFTATSASQIDQRTAAILAKDPDNVEETDGHLRLGAGGKSFEALKKQLASNSDDESESEAEEPTGPCAG